MRFHGGFRNRQLVCDLFVEQALGQHHQDPHLLRRERGEPREEIVGLCVGAVVEIDIRRRPFLAGQHARDGIAHRLHAQRLRNETGRAEMHATADDGGIFIGGNDDDGNAGMLRAQAHQTGEAAHAGHREIEQDEIDVTVAAEQLADFFEAAGFRDVDALGQAFDCPTQRAPKQRMVVGDNQTIG
jgi:hypothetical protein